MNNIVMRLLFFILLPILAILSYPTELFSSAYGLIGVVIAFITFVGFMLFRGKTLALTFMIFMQGMNVIVRLMMLFSQTVSSQGQFDLPFLVTGLFGLGLSLFLLIRLDQADVRDLMVS